MFPLRSAVSKHEEGASSESGTFSLRDPVPLSRCVQGYALSRRCRMDAHGFPLGVRLQWESRGLRLGEML